MSRVDRARGWRAQRHSPSGTGLAKISFALPLRLRTPPIKGLRSLFSAFLRFFGRVTRFVNIMDDSGLENLKRVKRALRPAKIAPAYIVSQSNRGG